MLQPHLKGGRCRITASTLLSTTISPSMSTTPAVFEGEIRCVASLTALPGKADEVISMLKACEVSANSNAEPGTLSYEIIRYKDEICIVEKYANAAAIKAHTETPSFQAIIAKGAELVVEDSYVVKFYESA